MHEGKRDKAKCLGKRRVEVRAMPGKIARLHKKRTKHPHVFPLSGYNQKEVLRKLQTRKETAKSTTCDVRETQHRKKTTKENG